MAILIDILLIYLLVKGQIIIVVYELHKGAKYIFNKIKYIFKKGIYCNESSSSYLSDLKMKVQTILAYVDVQN